MSSKRTVPPKPSPADTDIAERGTVRMQAVEGPLARDTVRESPQEVRARLEALGHGSPYRRDPKRAAALDTAGRKESGVFALGASESSVARGPGEQALPKVDLSRADSRHRPTMKVTRKLDAYVPPDRSLRSIYAEPHERESASRGSFMARERIALWVVLGLVVLAIVLGILVLRAPSHRVVDTRDSLVSSTPETYLA